MAQHDLGAQLQALLSHNVQEFGNNLRQASHRAAELCQQAFRPAAQAAAPLLAVSTLLPAARLPVQNPNRCLHCPSRAKLIAGTTRCCLLPQSVSARLAGGRAAAPAAASAALPLFDLAYNPEEIKARLTSVPVYAVVNNKNEFVLVSGTVRGGWQAGSREGAAKVSSCLHTMTRHGQSWYCSWACSCRFAAASPSARRR